MAAILPESAAERLTPLERFVRDYIETAGGVWDEIEPQVYDVLLPTEDRKAVTDAGGREILQVTFDPEALPEHPAAQLASFGTPLVDRLLAGAIRRGRYAQVYWNGLNLSPHDLSGRIHRALTLPGDVTLQAGRVRALDLRRRCSGSRPRLPATRKRTRSSPWPWTCTAAARSGTWSGCWITRTWRRSLRSPCPRPAGGAWPPPIRLRGGRCSARSRPAPMSAGGN